MGLTRQNYNQLDTKVTQLDDALIPVNHGKTGTNTSDIGFVFERGDQQNVAMVWNEMQDMFRLMFTSNAGEMSSGTVAPTASAPILTGTHYISSGNFTADGDARAGSYVMRNETTDATQTELFLDGTSERLVITPNSVWTYEILVSAKRTDSGSEAASFKYVGAIGRNVDASSVFLVGRPSATVIGRTDALWTASVSADTANGSLAIKVSGAVGKTVRWVAKIISLEVVYNQDIYF